jgi:hypothetical protein
VERVHREPLQPRNLNRLLVVTMHNARAFTQNLHRTRSSTTGTQDIRIEDGPRRASEIAARYFFYEARHINMRRASNRAGRIKAEEAAIRLWDGCLPVIWRVQISETLNHFRLRRDLLMKWSSFGHQ